MNKYGGIRPSGLPKLFGCVGSAAMELGMPRAATEYAAEGTVAHLISAWALENRKDCSELIGKTYKVDGFSFEVTDEMAEYCQVYVDAVWLKAKGNVLMVEKDVDLSHVFGIPGAKGQIDALVIAGDTIYIDDLKYGMGVKVEETPQLVAYALGAIDDFGDFVGDINKVVLTIHQPRLNHIYSWEVSNV